MALRRSVGALGAWNPRYLQLSGQPTFSIPIPPRPKQIPSWPPEVNNKPAVSVVSRITELLRGDPDLQAAKINPSPDLLPQILNQFGSSSQKPWLTLLNGQDYEYSMEVFNAVIDSLAKAREFGSAWRLVLDHAHEGSSVRPNFDTFAILIRRYTRVFTNHQEAIHTFEFACSLALFHDLDSQRELLEALLDSLCKRGHVSIASQYVAKQRVKDPSFSPSIRMYNTLLRGCFLARKPENAEHLWMQIKEEKIKPTAVTYGILVASLCRKNRLEKALKVIDEMKKEGLELNANVYNPIIDGLAAACRFKEALGMLERLSVSEQGPTVSTYNSLVKSFCKAGDLVQACEIVRMMISTKRWPTSDTYGYFFKRFSKEGKVDLSLNLYYKMIRCGYEPDCLTYHLIVRMVCEEGNVELARQIIKGMRARGFDLDLATSIMLIQLLCQFRSYKEAVSEFEDMLRRGHVPTHQSYLRIRKELEEQKRTEVVKKLDGLMLSVQNSTELPDDEKISCVVQKAEAISDSLKKCKKPRLRDKWRHRKRSSRCK